MKENIYYTVGQLAKEMDVSVRTLQYYDKKGLLKPSTLSEGGRRLYTSKDMVKLHQILSLKYLGFSLEDIKSKLFVMDDPKLVAQMLDEQSKVIEMQISDLNKAYDAINSLKEEVLQIDKVDFTKYSDIISLLKTKNKNFWVFKFLDDKLANHVRGRFKDNVDIGNKLFDKYNEMLDKAIELKRSNETYDSEVSINLAKQWWDMINDFTGGDMTLLPQLMKFNDNKENWNNDFKEKQEEIDEYIGKALEAYFKSINMFIPEMEGK